jgi:hypothetical protein
MDTVPHPREAEDVGRDLRLADMIRDPVLRQVKYVRHDRFEVVPRDEGDRRTAEVAQALL